MAMKTLFDGQTADGASDPVTVRQDTKQIQLEEVLVEVSGNLGGGDVVLQSCLDLAESPQVWVAVKGGTWTAAETRLASLPTGTSVRANLSGSSGADVTVRVRGDV